MTSRMGALSSESREKSPRLDRRGFMWAAIAVVAAGPASAQTSGKIWRVGLVRGGVPPADVLDAAFRKGLADLGYVEGQNVVIDTRYAEGRYERYPQLVAELLALKPDALVVGAAPAIRAARAATQTIPIVANDLESDPVASGFVKSLARPGGNVTGTFLDVPEMAGKQLQFFQETVPRMTSIAVLWESSVNRAQLEATEAAARHAGLTLLALPVQRSEELDAAIGQAGRGPARALLVLTSPLVFTNRARIAQLALKQRLPSMSMFSVFPDAGGLMAYGPNFPDVYRRCATYVDRIFKGASPGNLPIERPSTFELVINLKTAKTIGLTIPPSLLRRADHVIQ